MKKAIDHQLNRSDAGALGGAVLLPRDIRIEVLQRIQRDRGIQGLIELFADVIGLANQVNDNSRKVIEDYLVSECGHDIETAQRLNLPDLFGGLRGVEIAITPKRGMCKDCAFRQGTPANQCQSSVADAQWSDDFDCHLTPGVSAGRPCAGFMASKRYVE